VSEYGGTGYGPGAGERPKRGAGPTVLVVLGILSLLGALGAGVLGARAMVEVIPLGILTLSGEPGDKVVAVLDTPGTTELELDGGEDYSFFLVAPENQRPSLGGEITVLAPDGSASAVAHTALASETTVGSTTARAVADLVATSSGGHVIQVPRPSSPDAEVWLADVTVPEAPVASIFGGVAGIFLAVILGLVGVGLLVAGLVWRVLRRPPDTPRAQLAPPLH